MNAKQRRKAARRVTAERSAPRANIRGGIEMAAPAYEGATRSYRYGNKGLSPLGPNTAVTSSLRTLVNRVREAMRNNPVVHTTTESYVSNLVGTGAVARWPDQDLQTLWEQWVNVCDADERLTFAGLQSLVGRTEFADGESLVRFRYRPNNSSLPVPLQLQAVEADYLDPSYTLVYGTQRIIAGKQITSRGTVSHYHLWKYHPSDGMALTTGNQRFAIPARDIIHVYRTTRPGQLRGVPALAPVLLLLNELDQMVDAAVVRAKLAELFGAFVTAPGPDAASPLGQDLGATDPDGQPFNDPQRGQLGGITAGAVHFLEPGEEIVFSTPPKMENLDAVIKYVLRTVARTAGLTYEQVSGDLSDVNFSSLRAGLVEARRHLEVIQQDIIIHQLCRRVAARWLHIAVASGRWNAPADFYRDPQAYMPTWMMPKFRNVQPLTDAQADLLEVRAGFAPLSDKQMERGYWPDQLNEQIEAQQDLPIVLDSNPRATNQAGKVQTDLAPNDDISPLMSATDSDA